MDAINIITMKGSLIKINRKNNSIYRVWEVKSVPAGYIVIALDTAKNALDKFDHHFVFTDAEFADIKVVNR